MRKALPILIALTLVLAACGSDEGTEGDGTTTTGAQATDAPTTTVTPTTAPPATNAAETTVATETTVAAETTVDPGDGDGDAVPVELTEWTLTAATELTAGSVAFTVANIGGFGHEFAVAKGDSYDTLPQLPSGAVDEATLGADFIGRTDVIASGDSTDVSFDLEPGNYVLFCNIAVGPNSHAAQGQTLSITVG